MPQLAQENLQVSPQLEAPGAGLPLMERVLARYWILPRLFMRPWDDATRRFRKDAERVRELVRRLTPEQLAQPVLIKRIPGLEDSSRYWSVAMTLDHLVQTSEGTARAIIALSRGETMGPKARIEDLKPVRGDALAAERSAWIFDDLVSKLPGRLSREVVDIAAKGTYEHPWFGHLTAHQWHWMLSVHLNLHRRQIELILKNLEGSKS